MRPNRLISIISAITLTTGTLAGIDLAYGDDKSNKEKVAMAQAAKVSIEQAIQTASEKVSGKVIEAELERKHKTLVWEVEVVTPENKIMEVHIDAESGSVIDVEEEKPKRARSPKERGPTGKP